MSESGGQLGHTVTYPEVKAYKLRLKQKLIKWQIFIIWFTGKV